MKYLCIYESMLRFIKIEEMLITRDITGSWKIRTLDQKLFEPILLCVEPQYLSFDPLPNS